MTAASPLITATSSAISMRGCTTQALAPAQVSFKRVCEYMCVCVCMCVYVRVCLCVCVCVNHFRLSLSLSLGLSSFPLPNSAHLAGWLPACLHHHQLSLTRPQTDHTLLTSRKAFRARAQRGRASAPSHRIMTAAKVVLATIPKALIHCF